MWINPENQQRYNTHADIRIGWPNVSLPAVLSESIIQELGLQPIESSNEPEYDAATQIVEENLPILDEGVWRQQWQVRAITAEEMAERRDLVFCDPRQARLALLAAGLLDLVEAWVATQNRAVQIEWQVAPKIRRNWPLIANAAADLGLTDAGLDALFAQALLL